MAKNQYLEQAFLNLIFNATPIPNIADNAASAPLTSYYISLHTADPGATGNQTTNEVSYTGYARVPVARSNSGFTVATGSGPASVSPVSTISFPQVTGGSNVATYAAIGTASTGTGHILYSGLLSSSITCAAPVTPQLNTSTAITES